MIISEVIKGLEILKDVEGDIDVRIWDDEYYEDDNYQYPLLNTMDIGTDTIDGVKLKPYILLNHNLQL